MRGRTRTGSRSWWSGCEEGEEGAGLLRAWGVGQGCRASPEGMTLDRRVWLLVSATLGHLLQLAHPRVQSPLPRRWPYTKAAVEKMAWEMLPGGH